MLVSTAVGQEGLDFHPYCHIVVHWNLPTNPVDLEQCEGRVHRCHAIRKNVARRHGAAALSDGGPDPWSSAFTRAVDDRQESDSELVPFWIYPDDDGAAVERHILALPLSRELDRLDALRNALAIYRLAFGQARQEDVIDHLLRRLGPTARPILLASCASTYVRRAALQASNERNDARQHLTNCRPARPPRPPISVTSDGCVAEATPRGRKSREEDLIPRLSLKEETRKRGNACRCRRFVE